MSDEQPKLRLRPRLTPDDVAAEEAASESPSAAPAEPMPMPPTASPAPEEPPKLKLRPAATEPKLVGGPTAATFPVAAQPVSSDAGATAEVTSPPPAATVSPESVRRVKLAAFGIGAAGIVLFVAVAWIAFPRLMAGANDDGSEAAEQTTAPAPAPAAAPATAPAVEFAATSAAEDWVRQVRISGVRGGSSPRVLLEGRPFAVGEIVNTDLGVVFAGYDASRRLLQFKDADGQLIERPDR